MAGKAKKIIYGIQQLGVGVPHAETAFRWYGTHLGADVKLFDDDNTATHMAKYMGGEPRKKRALLVMNLQGGSGYEIWQYADREPQYPAEPIRVGDYGIQIGFIKTYNIEADYHKLKGQGVKLLSDILTDPDGRRCFLLEDPYRNWYKVRENDSWFAKKDQGIGGGLGASIGVSDIDAALPLYSGVLGYDKVIYDETGHFEDLAILNEGQGQFRRVLLAQPNTQTGGFSPLLGESELELIQELDGRPRQPIFKDRYWGDMGFIHLCFDVRHIESLVEECAEAGFPFVVYSGGAFDMGEAAGKWGYLEDPDGTLIEFVETLKVPIVKKWNWNIHLTKRPDHKPLPSWLIKALSFQRVKFK